MPKVVNYRYHPARRATSLRPPRVCAPTRCCPACDMLDKVGYYSLECWGGATFDACLRFLNEDPWERLRKLRKALPNTKLQMLLARPEPAGLQALCRRRGESSFVNKSIEERHRHHPHASTR